VPLCRQALQAQHCLLSQTSPQHLHRTTRERQSAAGAKTEDAVKGNGAGIGVLQIPALTPCVGSHEGHVAGNVVPPQPAGSLQQKMYNTSCIGLKKREVHRFLTGFWECNSFPPCLCMKGLIHLCQHRQAVLPLDLQLCQGR